MWRFCPLRLSPDASLRVSDSHRSISQGDRLINEPLLASDASPRSCRHVATPPPDRYRSYRAVTRRGRWVLRLFRFESHPKLTSCFIIFPPLQLPPQIFGFWRSERPATPRPDRYQWYRSATKARRWVLWLCSSGSNPKLTNYFYGHMIYLRPGKPKAVEGLRHLSMASSSAHPHSNPLKRLERQWYVYAVAFAFDTDNYF